ncbi:hypothetical protein GXM_00564 [Nostoc sphaeroides CCNUC1]|uniref:Uncharacterized protein n=1 Tax=Nostoc sphaeroides CCNUC1 TaxID=2653204 RepID=A0A5P8VS08_9NOSO|nr:hypothetical protein GXM_00564 [Nostoc sphaeroides CCNUC1]
MGNPNTAVAPQEELPKGFPTPVRTTGGKYANDWLDLRKVFLTQRNESEIFTTHLGLLYQ